AIASASTAGLVYLTAPRTSPAPAAAAATAAPSANAALTVTTSTTDQTAMIAQAQKSVVTITTSGAASNDPFGRGGSGGGVGSGIIVSADGLILTNAHVVAGGGTLTVQLQDGRQLPGTVVSSDAAKDLAIVRVQATGLTPAQIGKSSGIKVGESVVAIGTPLGEYAESVTAGIISATNRTITVAGDRRGQGTQLSGLLQTDAAINPGNSGGPLIDAAGNVIGGVTAASGAAQGIGFAIPIDEAASMIAAASTAS
ncbi:MAG: trypsin-like peptidase domain-containing protein, partial [Chloroflexota bacterium]|nr:trypsin-like peptidase domain-containing protein [Chloroflexota bacterium]